MRIVVEVDISEEVIEAINLRQNRGPVTQETLKWFVRDAVTALESDYLEWAINHEAR